MKARLTVLHITSSGARSGGVRQALLLAGRLRDEGHRVLFCAPPGSVGLGWAEEAGLDARAMIFGSPWAQWKASRVLRGIVHDEGVDLVHSHHTKGHDAALLATIGGGFPPVIANRGVIFRPEFPAKFKSGRTAAIITNSEAAKRVLAEAGVPGAKIHVVYNAKELPDLERIQGLLPGLREELGLDAHAPVVGAVGSGRAEKGFQFLVEAAPRILRAYPAATFVVLGNGVQHLREKVAALGLEERFRFTGYRADAVALMGLFHVLAFPSVGMDSCPNVVLEAMGVGVPVVGTHVGGVPEMVQDGVTGRLIQPADSVLLGEVLVEVLSHPDAARVMGARGREALGQRFTLEAKLQATVKVYEKVLPS